MAMEIKNIETTLLLFDDINAIFIFRLVSSSRVGDMVSAEEMGRPCMGEYNVFL